MQLPPALTQALEAQLEGVSRTVLAQRAKTMSLAYRAGGTSTGISCREDALAYALARSPATFAAASAVLARLGEVMPDFAPTTLLDVGAGTGAVSVAARMRWPDATVTMVEPNPAMRALAAQLLPDAACIAGDLNTALPQSDLVLAGYMLVELEETRVADAARSLWQAATQALVMVEPGTPTGFARIRAARAALIEAGAHVAAPCTHDDACPMAGDDWCHFSQRLARSRDHMFLKNGTAPFEDERYSYVVAMRGKVSSGARILAPPLDEKPGLTFKLCDETGLHAQFVPAREKPETRRVRRKIWGDLF